MWRSNTPRPRPRWRMPACPQPVRSTATPAPGGRARSRSTVDTGRLGSVQSILPVVLNWEPAYATAFRSRPPPTARPGPRSYTRPRAPAVQTLTVSGPAACGCSGRRGPPSTATRWGVLGVLDLPPPPPVRYGNLALTQARSRLVGRTPHSRQRGNAVDGNAGDGPAPSPVRNGCRSISVPTTPSPRSYLRAAYATAFSCRPPGRTTWTPSTPTTSASGAPDADRLGCGPLPAALAPPGRPIRYSLLSCRPSAASEHHRTHISDRNPPARLVSSPAGGSARPSGSLLTSGPTAAAPPADSARWGSY